MRLRIALFVCLSLQLLISATSTFGFPSGSSSSQPGCDNCEDCVEVCLNDECVDSGMKKCPRSVLPQSYEQCIPQGDDCSCNPASRPGGDTPESNCIYECTEGSWGPRLNWHWCEATGECYFANGENDDLYCSECNPPCNEGCSICLSDVNNPGKKNCVDSAGSRKCRDGTCPRGFEKCPEQCRPPCSPCIQSCRYDGRGAGNYECVGTGKKLCPNGRCIDQLDACEVPSPTPTGGAGPRSY